MRGILSKTYVRVKFDGVKYDNSYDKQWDIVYIDYLYDHINEEPFMIYDGSNWVPCKRIGKSTINKYSKITTDSSVNPSVCLGPMSIIENMDHGIIHTDIIGDIKVVDIEYIDEEVTIYSISPEKYTIECGIVISE